MIICDNKKCTGCGLCSLVCPLNAVSMVLDEYHFAHPIVNEEKCSNCGLCKKKCPVQNVIPGVIVEEAYATYAKDMNIHLSSQSGGLAYLISAHVIGRGGVVYGQAFDEYLNLCSKRVEKVSDLKQFQMSKYVQGSIVDSFQCIENDLCNGRTVLFIGTPCQLAAIISYVPRELRKNLLTVSFVCGGVASLQNLKDTIKRIKKKKDIQGS